MTASGIQIDEVGSDRRIILAAVQEAVGACASNRARAERIRIDAVARDESRNAKSVAGAAQLDCQEKSTFSFESHTGGETAIMLAFQASGRVCVINRSKLDALCMYDGQSDATSAVSLNGTSSSWLGNVRWAASSPFSAFHRFLMQGVQKNASVLVLEIKAGNDDRKYKLVWQLTHRQSIFCGRYVYGLALGGKFKAENIPAEAAISALLEALQAEHERNFDSLSIFQRFSCTVPRGVRTSAHTFVEAAKNFTGIPHFADLNGGNISCFGFMPNTIYWHKGNNRLSFMSGELTPFARAEDV
ncbi:hypothetical protein SCHPADRAFT_887897 [Schizopora paradoxa]|uniref:Uncharacterized protein n=1 Tax=Schizopora paradoxa TaxID=27342 RepID=A0A0H2RXA3_9AGAM|nr:hypothetical protein SCHPADRAFT_887897 [Schizopora paradoxa]